MAQWAHAGAGAHYESGIAGGNCGSATSQVEPDC